MSGPATLLAVLGALYLLECITAVPGGLVAFRGAARASWQLVVAGFRIGTNGTRLVLAPLPPWSGGVLFAGGDLAVALREEATADGAAHARALSFDVEGVRGRIADLHRATTALRVDALAMFFLVLVAAPVIVRLLGWETSWPFILAAVAGLATLIVDDYRRAYAELFPASDGAPIATLLTLALSPASAMRAADSLGRALLVQHHVLAVARVLCAPAEFERLAAGCVRAWRRGALRDPSAEAFLASELGDLAQLAAPPPRRDDSALAYCPSCLAEFVRESGECETCGGVRLERFTESVV